MKRIEQKFQQLKSQNKCAFVAYICAGDPDFQTSLAIAKKLPENGVDIIELGVPFLDPSGDGPIIENAAKRAIKNSASLKSTLQIAFETRKINDTTPIILMGYYNSFFKYGLAKIFIDAEKSGVDGVLIVDLPIEEQGELIKFIQQTNLDFINLVAPLTDEKRIQKIQKNASGFLYLISMLGITGTKKSVPQDNIDNIKKIRDNSNLPIVIGFGIQDSKQAQEFIKIGVDGVVIGSAIVKEIENALQKNLEAERIVEQALQKVREFAKIIS